jgi:hypothetical protein
MIGHGMFIGHFTRPDGFYFQREMHQCHLLPGETFRSFIVRTAWEIHDMEKKYIAEVEDHIAKVEEIDKANARANSEDDDEFFASRS